MYGFQNSYRGFQGMTLGQAYGQNPSFYGQQRRFGQMDALAAQQKAFRVQRLGFSFAAPSAPKPRPPEKEPEGAFPESWYHRNVWGMTA